MTLISGCLYGFSHCDMESLYFNLLIFSYTFCMRFCNQLLLIIDYKGRHVGTATLKCCLSSDSCYKAEKKKHFEDDLESYLHFSFLYCHILLLLFKNTYSVAELYMYILWYTKQAVLQAGLHCSNSYRVTFSSWRLYV